MRKISWINFSKLSAMFVKIMKYLNYTFFQLKHSIFICDAGIPRCQWVFSCFYDYLLHTLGWLCLWLVLPFPAVVFVIMEFNFFYRVYKLCNVKNFCGTSTWSKWKNSTSAKLRRRLGIKLCKLSRGKAKKVVQTLRHPFRKLKSVLPKAIILGL